jgi:hypothetical protein
MKRAMMAGLFLACGGCSSTPADLEAKATPAVQPFSENYQEIYRRAAGTAKRCIAGNVGAYASMAVDTELYSDLGYGEITVSMINWGARNYYLSARIEKAQQSGSKVVVRTGNTLGADNLSRSLMRWSAGETEC